MPDFNHNSADAMFARMDERFENLRAQIKAQDDKRWAYLQIETDHRQSVSEKLVEIKNSILGLDGRVAALETDRARIKGGVAVLAAIGSVGWAIYEAIDHVIHPK